MKGNKQSGFTLIELLVSVCILAILSSIAIGAFAKFKRQSYYATAVSDLRNIRTAMGAGLSDNPDSALVGWTMTDPAGGPIPAALKAVLPGAVTSANIRVGAMFRECREKNFALHSFISAYPCKGDKYISYMRMCNGTEITWENQPLMWRACGF